MLKKIVRLTKRIIVKENDSNPEMGILHFAAFKELNIQTSPNQEFNSYDALKKPNINQAVLLDDYATKGIAFYLLEQKFIPNFTDSTGVIIFEVESYSVEVLTFVVGDKSALSFALSFTTKSFELIDVIGGRLLLSEEESKRQGYSTKYSNPFMVDFTNDITFDEYTIQEIPKVSKESVN